MRRFVHFYRMRTRRRNHDRKATAFLSGDDLPQVKYRGASRGISLGVGYTLAFIDSIALVHDTKGMGHGRTFLFQADSRNNI